MSVLRATMKVQCDHCKKLKMFVIQNPKKADDEIVSQGWFFSEQEDLCPDCHRKKWAR